MFAFIAANRWPSVPAPSSSSSSAHRAVTRPETARPTALEIHTGELSSGDTSEAERLAAAVVRVTAAMSQEQLAQFAAVAERGMGRSVAMSVQSKNRRARQSVDAYAAGGSKFRMSTAGDRPRTALGPL